MEHEPSLRVSVLPVKKRALSNIKWTMRGGEAKGMARAAVRTKAKTGGRENGGVKVVQVAGEEEEDHEDEDDLSPTNVMHFPTSAKSGCGRANASNMSLGSKRSRTDSLWDDAADTTAAEAACPRVGGTCRVDDDSGNTESFTRRDKSGDPKLGTSNEQQDTRRRKKAKANNNDNNNNKKKKKKKMEDNDDNDDGSWKQMNIKGANMNLKSRSCSLRSLLHEWVSDLELKIDSYHTHHRKYEVSELFVSLALHIYTRFLLRKCNVTSINDLRGVSVRKTELATALWIAMKLEEEQSIVPTSQEIADIVGIADKKALGVKEIEIGNQLNWRLLEGWRPMVQHSKEQSDSVDVIYNLTNGDSRLPEMKGDTDPSAAATAANRNERMWQSYPSAIECEM